MIIDKTAEQKSSSSQVVEVLSEEQIKMVAEAFHTEEKTIAAIGDLAVCRTFSVGALICLRGALADEVMVLTSGSVRVLSASGEEVFLQAPALMGEMGLFLGNRRSADVIATESVQAICFSVAELHARGRQGDPYVYELLQNMASIALKRSSSETRSDKKYVVLLSHERMLPVLLSLGRQHRQKLGGLPLISTFFTAMQLEERLGLRMNRKMSQDRHGGLQEIGGLVARGQVHMLIFLKDRSMGQSSEDVQALIRLCEVMDVPMATNASTADMMLAMLDSDSEMLDSMVV